MSLPTEIAPSEIFYPASGIAPYTPKPNNDRPEYEQVLEISPFGHPFVKSVWDHNQALLDYPTLVERKILTLSRTIRKKPEWWVKYKNPEIVAKWRSEIVEQPKPEEDTSEEKTGDDEVKEDEKMEGETVEEEEVEDDNDKDLKIEDDGDKDLEGENNSDEDLEDENDSDEDLEDEEEQNDDSDLGQIEDEDPDEEMRGNLPEAKTFEEDSEMKVSPAIFDYVIAELAWYERARSQTKDRFQLDNIDYIFYGDKVVSDDLKKALIAGVKKLEDVPGYEKDWHPGSNQRVLDLVHPSLYPLQYGITPVVADLNNDHVGFQVVYSGPCVPVGSYENRIKSEVGYFGVGKRFQWLPSIFSISKDDEPKVEIASYINNLHPVHNKDLYQPIADIFAQFVPAINVSLTHYASKERVRYDPFIHENGLYGPEPEFDEEASDYDDKYDEYMDNREPIPTDPVWKEPEEDSIFHVDVRGTRLKVIVKLANIELTPERPDYPGGTWHVEGTINEDIVCTCLYYYDVENITHSEIRFRAAVRDPQYEQNDSSGTIVTFGMDDADVASYPIGAIDSLEDRLIVFPNMFQHYVSPFELADKTKPGHRKILCFFVCDPYDDSVISTDQVPPQQADWWNEVAFGTGENARPTYFDQLPAEVLSAVLDKVEWPMPLKRAQKLREELMEERKMPSDNEYHRGAFHRSFSLCEH